MALTPVASASSKREQPESTAVPIHELIPECGHKPQRFSDLDKFGELREHARFILLLAKARHRVGDVFFVPIRQLLLHVCEQRFETFAVPRIVGPLVGTTFSNGAQQLRRRNLHC